MFTPIWYVAVLPFGTVYVMKAPPLLGFALAYGGMLQAQCPNNNVLYNVSATPATCPGTASVGCIYGGEYVLVNVVAGNTYTFSTCGTLWDTQITLYNNTGGEALGYNDDFCGLQSTVMWTATFTGVLRVLVDQFNCASNLSCGGLTVTCAGAPIITDCVYTLTLNDSWGDGWEGSYVGISINGGAFMTYTVPNGRNLLGQVRTEVEDGVLRISNENTCNWVRSFKPRITVRTPAQGLERLVLRGTGNVSCVDTVRAASFAIEQWGAQGTTDLRVAVDHIEVGLHTGAGDVVLRGRCDGEARLYSGIMGPIDASALRAARVAVNNSGITDIRCWAEEELQVHIGDAGDVYFRGDPPAIVTDIQGSGRLLRLP